MTVSAFFSCLCVRRALFFYHSILPRSFPRRKLIQGKRFPERCYEMMPLSSPGQTAVVVWVNLSLEGVTHSLQSFSILRTSSMVPWGENARKQALAVFLNQRNRNTIVQVVACLKTEKNRCNPGFWTWLDVVIDTSSTVVPIRRNCSIVLSVR